MLKDKKIVYLVLLITSFIWGINPSIMKIGLKYLSPFSYNFYRILLSLIITLIITLFSKNKRKISKDDLKYIIIIGVFGFFAFQVFLIIGVKLSTGSNSALIMSLLPLIVCVLNIIIFKERATRKFVITVIITILGVMIVVLGSGNKFSLTKEYILGAIFIIISEIGYGIYTILSLRLSSKYSPYEIMSYILLITTVLSVPISINQLLEENITKIPIEAWVSIIFSGAFAMCIGNYTWIWAVKKIGSNKTAMYNNIQPVFGVIAGYILLGERLTLIQGIGAIIIILGLYISGRDK